ncbi:MAG: DUF1616 domain-containing protein [Patescibacteria group bacterium]
MFLKLNSLIKQNKKLFAIIFSLIIFIVLAFIIPGSFLTGVSVIIGTLLTLFLPGLFLIMILFPRVEKIHDLGKETAMTGRSIDGVERIVLSLFFSITLVALCLSIMRQLGVVFSPSIVVSVIVGMNALTLIGAIIRFRKQ